MTDERTTDLTPEQQAAKIAERKAREAKAQRDARLRFPGAILLGVIGGFKLTVGGAEGTSEILWVCVIAGAFGLASVEQILTALGKR